MQFIVDRTSHPCEIREDENGLINEVIPLPPCEGAYKKKFPRVETRTITTAAEFDTRYGRDERGYIFRIFPESGERFCIDFETLPELMAWIEKQEHSVIISKGYGGRPPELEIYDDYRE